MTRMTKRPVNGPVPGEVLNRLAAVVGDAYAIRDAGAMEPYLREMRDIYVGRAGMVLRPANTEEVSGILKIASETGTAIVPQGGNTGLVGGQIPFDTGNEVIVSLTRMNRIRETDVAGETMTVEAGVTLQQAREAAEEADKLFPLSLPSEGSCQIGGNLATNAGGAAMLAYGNARDMVLGLEVVLADGQVWDGLRALRKDNTGYHLKDIFIGSEGTLGIITAAVLKLFPRPREQATAFAGFRDIAQCAELFAIARGRAGMELTSFEILPRIGIDMVLRHGDNVRDPLAEAFPWYALIEISGHKGGGEASDAMEAILSEALERQVIADAALAASLAQSRDFWRIRELMSEVQRLEGGSIKHDVSVPLSRIPEFVTRASELAVKLVPGSRPVPFGHFGDGNVHFNVSQGPGMDKAEFMAQWERVTGAVHDLVTEMNGSISAEHGIGRMKRDLMARTKSPVEMDLQRRLKSALDPRGILNPDKVLAR
ncbi:MAG: FAD-binding oxidoreductase [Hyphomicrobiales bacterium]